MDEVAPPRKSVSSILLLTVFMAIGLVIIVVAVKTYEAKLAADQVAREAEYAAEYAETEAAPAADAAPAEAAAPAADAAPAAEPAPAE